MIILKDAYFLTLNPTDEFGRYSICIDSGKIVDVAKSNDSESGEKNIKSRFEIWTEGRGSKAEIIDCSNKIILPSLINSCLKSEGALIKYLLRNRHYENTISDLCTDFIFNYIYQEQPSSEIMTDLNIIYNYSYSKNLKSGVSSLNEFTPRKDTNHLNPISRALKITGQNISVCCPIKQDIKDNNLDLSYYLTDENQLTIYDLSLLNELKNGNIKKLFLEVSTNKDVVYKFKQTFNKPIIMLLDEYGLIDKNTSLINPLYLSYDEIKILAEKEASIIICPRDLMYFTGRYFPLDDFLNHNIKYSIGTGWLGDDLFKEIRLIRNRYKELSLSGIDLLRAVTQIPNSLYFKETQNLPGLYSHGRNADLIFVDTSDLRFQFFPENLTLGKLCDFLIDNLNSFTISDVMINGEFKIKNNNLIYASEDEIIKDADETRKRLYVVGKYDEIQERNKQRKNIEELDLRNRDDEEILFPRTGTLAVKEESFVIKEEPLIGEEEEFRIKSKMPLFKHKISNTQKNLFEETENHTLHTEENLHSPDLNLLYSEIDESKNTEEEIFQLKIAEAKLFKQTNAEKKAQPGEPEKTEGKIELPKDVKLKFGDD
ncbi:MAG: hypothetical protein ACRDFC_01535 [Ignavibacteria bacterium]